MPARAADSLTAQVMPALVLSPALMQSYITAASRVSFFCRQSIRGSQKVVRPTAKPPTLPRQEMSQAVLFKLLLAVGESDDITLRDLSRIRAREETTRRDHECRTC